MSELGKVKTFKREGQYGFIKSLESGEDFFVHKNSIIIRDDIDCPYPRLHRGEYVEFTVDTVAQHVDGKLRTVASVTGPRGHTLRCEDIAIDKAHRKGMEEKAQQPDAFPEQDQSAVDALRAPGSTGDACE